MRALITGGAGFIGSHLAEHLLANSWRVAILDDLSTGSMSNFRHLKQNPHFYYAIDSVMNQALLAEMVDDADIVFHLAAAVGVALIVESPVRTLDTNIRATELVLNAAVKKKKKVVITSTSEVYGKSNNERFAEDDDLIMGPPIRGRWSYACSKAIDEFMAIAYHRERGLPVVIVRLFNTVGPRQTGMYGMVLPRFVTQALSGLPITVYGDGTQTRCFGWVGDVVDAMGKLAQLPSAEGRIFNIGSDEEVSINILAEIVRDVTGSASPIVHHSYDEAYGREFEDMLRRVPDLTRIKDILGYKPTKKLQEIVVAVADDIRTRTSKEPAIARMIPGD